MWFGLHKPGAIPFLVLLVFSLLTLVLSMSSIYNLKLGDFGYYGSGARRMFFRRLNRSPLLTVKFAEVHSIKNGVAQFSPDTYPPDQRKEIIVTTPHQPRLNSLSRSSRAENDSPLPTNRSQVSFAAAESLMFTCRTRAFRTYCLQQLDDYQFLAPFSNRNLSTRTLNPLFTSPFAHSSSTSLPSDNRQHFYNFRTYNHKSISNTKGTENSVLQLPLMLHDMWQQVSRVTIEQWESFKAFTYTAFFDPINHLEFLAESILHTHPASPRTQASGSTPNESQAMTTEYQTYSNVSTQRMGAKRSDSSDSLGIVRDEREDAAAGRPVDKLRGSCMAVVIGLTVGVIWF